MTNLKRMIAVPLSACLLVMGAGSLQASGIRNSETAREAKTQALNLLLDSMDGIEVQGITDGTDPVKIQANVASYRGSQTVRIVNDDGPAGGVSGGQVLAIVKSSDFKDGTIEAEVAGFPRQEAKPGTRGFIG